MSDYQLYVFLMCLVVFLLLASLSIFCIAIILRLTLRLINCGTEDKKIIKEYKKSRNKKPKSKFSKLVDYAFSGIVCLVMLAILGCAVFVKTNEKNVVGDMPVYRIVNTGSMSKKHEKNTYLDKNNLDNQIQTFDLIKTEKLPGEFDLKLYDIVVYEVDDLLVVHRIVEIEEPNEYHPNCRHFKLQGDAVEAADRFPVLYSQMRAIYRGTRVPFVGSFIMFMQSPAGWLCVLFVVLSLVAMPILDNKLEKSRKVRLQMYLDRIERNKSRKFNTVIVLNNSKSKQSSVSLEQLNASYKAGGSVDIHSLKRKGLIDKDCQRVEILAQGELKKPLTVKAHSFEGDAIKKIKSANGQVVKATSLVSTEVTRASRKIEGVN